MSRFARLAVQGVMPMRQRTLALAMVVGLAGCNTGTDVVGAPDAGRDAGADAGDAGQTTGDAGGGGDAGEDAGTEACTATLCLASIEPSRAPFDATRVAPVWVGGRESIVATLRGVGFTPDASVAIGDRVLPAEAIERVSDEELRVTMPPSAPGTFDVTVHAGAAATVLRGAFTYDPVSLRPHYGPSGGGTALVVAIAGMDLGASDRVFVGDAECASLRRSSSRSLRCTIPPGAGTAALRIERTGADDVVVPDAFTYVDGPDALFGGLGGGPLAGSLAVELVDAASGEPIAGATVVADPGGAPVTGTTDASGRATLSVGGAAVALHAASACHERASIARVSQREARVLLAPTGDPGCPPVPPPCCGRTGAFLEGRIEWPGPAWGGVPAPGPGEQRVLYVGATLIGASRPGPDPSAGGGTAVLLEGEPSDFRVFVRDGYMSLYALAGIRADDTGALTPYVLGVLRDVAAGQGETRSGFVIPMRHALDRALELDVADAPTLPDGATARTSGTPWIDLGGEGQVLRLVTPGALLDTRPGAPGDVVEASGSRLSVARLPALEGELAGAAITVAIEVSGEGSDAYSRFVQTGLRPGTDPIEVRGLLAVPSPAGGARPADRTLRWSLPAGTGANLFVVTLRGQSDVPWQWRFVVNDAPARELVVPSVPGFADDYASSRSVAVEAIDTELTPLDRLQLGMIPADSARSADTVEFAP